MHQVDKSERGAKRPREEAKYPFVDFDAWMHADVGNFKVVSGDFSTDKQGASKCSDSRAPTEWFTLSVPNAVSAECHSAQYSAVAHSPYRQESPETEEACRFFSNQESLKTYIESRISISDTVFHPLYHYADYRRAQMYDVLSNACRRDPQLYKSSTLIVADTYKFFSDRIDRMPWSWEFNHRRGIMGEILGSISSLESKGDLLIPLRGLICSVWTAGILFRLSQLFFKITVAKSQISFSVWEDTYFVFCQGKRESSKLVDKAFKLLQRLFDQSTLDCSDWGFAVPPVCFTDPNFTEWIKRVNAQLIGARGIGERRLVSLENLASLHRIKKYLFPENSERMVGFFFGSFSPVHENHVSLCKFAREKLGIDTIFFVPNSDGNQDKDSSVICMQDRLEILTERAHQEEGEWMQVMEPSMSTKRWEAKAEIAKEKTEELFRNSRDRGLPVLLIGQDSWNQAVAGSSRDKTTRHFIGIAKLSGIKLFVFPRGDETVFSPPKPIREMVTVVEGYQDVYPGLSSTKIRLALNEAGASVEGLHPVVMNYISRRKFFS